MLESKLVDAIEAHRAGRMDVAEALYLEIIAQSPNPDAFDLLGILQYRSGRLVEGLQNICRSVALQPDMEKYRTDLTNAFGAALTEACRLRDGGDENAYLELMDGIFSISGHKRNEERKTLEILIPTWNRGTLLANCVRSVIREIQRYSDLSVRIVISNNGSTDDTDSVVDGLMGEFNDIHYYKNTCNIGISLNFIKLIHVSNAEYIWILGDDDACRPGALRTIFSTISDDNDYHVFVNDTIHNSNFVSNLFSISEFNGKSVQLKLFDIFNSLGWLYLSGFISTQVVRATGLKNTRFDIHFKNTLVYSCCILEAYANGRGMVIDSNIAYANLKSASEEEESIKRWRNENIIGKFFLLHEPLKYIFDKCIPDLKEKPEFYTYEFGISFFWDVLISMIIGFSIAHKKPPLDSMIEFVEMLINRSGHPGRRIMLEKFRECTAVAVNFKDEAVPAEMARIFHDALRGRFSGAVLGVENV